MFEAWHGRIRPSPEELEAVRSLRKRRQGMNDGARPRQNIDERLAALEAEIERIKRDLQRRT